MKSSSTQLPNLKEHVFLVTGAHGFIGAWIVKRLLAAQARVVIFDQSPDPARLRLIMNGNEIEKIQLITGDIIAPDTLPAIIEKFAVTNLIHLAGLQVPTCRANPHLGALVNVVGTINVFEAARASGGLINKVVYASSAAVFGASTDEHPVTERDEPQPESHYGVFKRCNEGNARVYYLDHGISSIGLRPLTVYGVGRDFGITSDPTKAMKAAVVGRPFHIRFGGRTDFQYVADTADAFIRASLSELEGVHVFNLHGETVPVAEIVAEIERVWPEAQGKVTNAETPLGIPATMDDSAIRAALGPLPSTPLAQGVRETMEHFAQLLREDRLQTRELDD
jgi:nucleoside-diphosphate-sugar epimerase